MPGYEKSQFVSLSQIEEDELLCGICFGIFLEPIVTPCCRQTYCNECILEWLNENNICPQDRSNLKSEALIQPPRLVINMLNKLQIKCSFLENGCKEVVLLEKLRQHMDCCKYNPKGICRECGVKNGDRGLHNCVENLLSHIKSIEKLKLEIFEKNLVLEKSIQKSIKENLEMKQEMKNLRKENYLIEEENRRSKQSVRSLRDENNKVKSKWEIDNLSLENLTKINSDLVHRNREINNKLENIIEYKNTYEDIMRRRN
jgi:hypothetical protein